MTAYQSWVFHLKILAIAYFDITTENQTQLSNMDELTIQTNFSNYQDSILRTLNKVIVMPVYNRPEYLSQTLISLQQTVLKDTLLILVDDGSDNTKLVDDFNMDIPWVKIYKQTNVGMNDSIVIGFDYALKHFPEIEWLLILDSDTIQKVHWLEEIMMLRRQFPSALISGFNTANHKTLATASDHVFKKDLGGVNLCFSKKDYLKIFQRILVKYPRRWDQGFSMYCRFHRIPIIATRPSVVQHIGKIGLNASNSFDQALDY